jgi:hypothetical protein
MARTFTVAIVGAALVALTACGSDTGSAANEPPPSVPLSTEHSESEFCVTYAALDSSSVFLHAGEDTIRPGLELQIEQIEALRTTLPAELSETGQTLDTRLAAAQATLDIYAANGFDADEVSADPAFGEVSDKIGASIQADVVEATRETRTYCGIEL